MMRVHELGFAAWLLFFVALFSFVDMIGGTLLLLPVDRTIFRNISEELEISVARPTKGDLILTQTEPWESWAVFGYNSVVQATANNGLKEHRMYYDCIEGAGVPPGDDAGYSWDDISHRRICLATSQDGIIWTKPNLGLFERNGSKANNIVLEDSGVSVFYDSSASSDARWKMVCSMSAYESPDGLRWRKLTPFKPIATDDTKPCAYYDPGTKKYAIAVRRDLSSPDGKSGDVVRFIGRCDTDNLTDWQKEYNESGCPSIFGVDSADPDHVDIYTSAWTPYPSIDDPVVHLFFPSFYAHFGSSAPFGFSNDGLLDIRLVVSRDGRNLSYVPAKDGRSPYVYLGKNLCGPRASTPSVKGGWCDPKSGVENKTTADTSAMYMASGFVFSVDATEVFLYSSAQPFTHGGDAAAAIPKNTGIRLLRTRKHGFASVDSPYVFGKDSPEPSFTTIDVDVPGDCPTPQNVVLRVNAVTSVVGYVRVAVVGASGYGLDNADRIQGNTVDAVASWGGGKVSTLGAFSGTSVAFEVGMRDAKLFSLEVSCGE